MRCKCVIATGKNKGKTCSYTAKPHSDYCGVHKNCRKKEPEPVPVPEKLVDKVKYTFTNKGAKAHIDGYPEAKTNIVFEQILVKDYGYDAYVSSFKGVMINARISQLYSGGLPSGMIRQILCIMLTRSIDKGYLKPTDNICLEASGSVRDSFLNLINMYRRMSFKPVAVLQYDDELLTMDQVLEYIDKDKEIEALSVLMITKIKELLSWCQSRY